MADDPQLCGALNRDSASPCAKPAGHGPDLHESPRKGGGVVRWADKALHQAFLQSRLTKKTEEP